MSTRRRPQAEPLSLARLEELARLARPRQLEPGGPGLWSASDAMEHHAACRAAIAELVAELRPRLEREAASAARAERLRARLGVELASHGHTKRRR